MPYLSAKTLPSEQKALCLCCSPAQRQYNSRLFPAHRVPTPLRFQNRQRIHPVLQMGTVPLQVQLGIFRQMRQAPNDTVTQIRRHRRSLYPGQDPRQDPPALGMRSHSILHRMPPNYTDDAHNQQPDYNLNPSTSHTCHPIPKNNRPHCTAKNRPDRGPVGAVLKAFLARQVPTTGRRRTAAKTDSCGWRPAQ